LEFQGEILPTYIQAYKQLAASCETLILTIYDKDFDGDGDDDDDDADDDDN